MALRIPGPKVPVPSHPQVLLSSREDGSPLTVSSRGRTLSTRLPDATRREQAFLVLSSLCCTDPARSRHPLSNYEARGAGAGAKREEPRAGSASARHQQSQHPFTSFPSTAGWTPVF